MRCWGSPRPGQRHRPDARTEVDARESSAVDKAMSARQADLVVEDVLDYWLTQTGTKPRSPKVIDAFRKRIASRLADGFTPADLKRVVDFAKWDDWYSEKGYFRQPDVIWRNAERVESILARVQRTA